MGKVLLNEPKVVEVCEMPGLPIVPAANGMDISDDGEIIGLS
jgi:formyltetrahydrofolate synthetase